MKKVFCKLITLQLDSKRDQSKKSIKGKYEKKKNFAQTPKGSNIKWKTCVDLYSKTVEHPREATSNTTVPKNEEITR